MFLASFFMNLPFTGPGKELVAVHDIPSLQKTAITRRQFDEVNSWRVRPTDVKAVMGRTSILEQTLVGWDTDETAEYCATPSTADEALPERKERWPD